MGDDQHLWHPFADMALVRDEELTLVSGDGAWVTDADGRRYLDGSAALWFCNVGHGRGELADAAADQMRRLAAYHTFDVFANEPALELARRLALITPTGPRSAAFFTSGGSEAVETACKLARRYWHVRGQKQRRIIVAREGAYHGMAGFGTSLAGIGPNRVGWGPLVQDVVHVQAHNAAALARALKRHGDAIAAFIGEPVIGAGGVHPPPVGYWEQVQSLCREHDVLLIADEVVTGFGRLGTAFGCERYGLTPDLLCAAKGLSSGYAPLGVVMSGARVRDVLWGAGAGSVRHGYTYSGHAAACAVGLANLDVLDRERLYDRVRSLEPVLAEALAPLAAHPLVEDVRTVGLLAGVQLDAGARASMPDLVERVVRRARRGGVLVRNLVGHTLQISPPFVIEADEIALLAEVLVAALDETARELGDAPAPFRTAGDHRQTA